MVTDSAPQRLATYRRMRDFARTPEPSGDRAAQAGDRPLFVVQRHRAPRLHYDFRLEIDGVLASAGRCRRDRRSTPAVRRMAVHVEDHPMEYADFEGVIPARRVRRRRRHRVGPRHLGAAEADDPVAAIAAGELHLDLYGEKLRGRFVLVRTGGPGKEDQGEKEQWLLLHKHDEHAVEGWDPEEHPRSVLSGRTNDEVKADPDRRWHSDRPAAEAAEDLDAAPDGVDADDDELAALDDLRPARAPGRSSAASCASRTSTRCCSPPARARIR